MAATRETVTIPCLADHLTVLAQDGMAERYELDRLKILWAALLALHNPLPADHLASGIPCDPYNGPGQPREHSVCHFLRTTSCYGSFVQKVRFLPLCIPFVV
ncbi:MAG TPA: hypothetical protein VFZ27_02775 [Terriglobia bacterium]|nr:hypothetical protein [Terriglobia bacterium]HEX5410762.1 hypothetical protein [Terriglobia bacterium]